MRLTKTELNYLIKALDQCRPFRYQISSRDPQALLWARVTRKLEDARSGRQKRLEVFR